MKNIIDLYKLDWSRIFKNRIALLLILALTIIPSLYAWFNIAALWDPYKNTGDLKVAVYSDDQKQKLNGKSVHIGNKIIGSLKNNKSMKWIFPESKDDMIEGVKSGDYYAGIYVPRTFSKDILSFKDGKITKPKIEYISNQKINAIAPKLTDKAAESVINNVSQSFIDAATSTVFSEMNRLGIDADSSIPMLKKAKSLVFAFEENQGMIDNYVERFMNLKNRLPEIDKKLQQANTIVDLFPEINKAGDMLITMNYRLDDIDKIGALLNTLNERKTDFEMSTKDFNNMSLELDSLESALSDMLAQSKEAVDLLSTTQSAIDSMNSNSSKFDTAIDDFQKFNNNIKNAFSTINYSVDSSLSTIDIMANSTMNSIDSLVNRLESPYLSENDKSSLIRALRSIHDNSKKTMEGIYTLKGVLSKIQELSGNPNLFAGTITYLDNSYNILYALVDMSEKFLTDPINLSLDGLKAYTDELKSNRDALKKNIEPLKSLNIAGDAANALNGVSDMLSASNNTLEKAKEITPKLSGLMAATQDSLQNSSEILTEYKNNIPVFREKIANIQDLLGVGIETLNFGMNKALYFYNMEFPPMRNKLFAISDFAKRDLPQLESEIEKELTELNKAFPKVDNAVNIASDFIVEDYPKLKEANHKIAKILKNSENDIDLEAAMKVLRSDAKKEGDFFADPILMKKNILYGVPNYGSASAPFYTALCLWVGGLLLASILTTKFYLGDDSKKCNDRDKFFARFLTFLTIGIMQAFIVSAGNLIILGTYAANPLIFVLSTIFISVIFMTIIYTLVYLFDNVGKGAAIVILVLSISAGGGNFPIELSGKFFRIIHPMLPFTHAVNLLRETVGGIYIPGFLKDIGILLVFGALFLVVGSIFHQTISRKFKKLTEKADESHIFH